MEEISGPSSERKGMMAGVYKGKKKSVERRVRRPGNTIRELMADERFIEPALNFLRSTEAGRVKWRVVFSTRAP